MIPYASKIWIASEINKLLQSDLDKNAMELGRERHNVSQLQKQLNVQTEAHQELIGHVKTIRCDIVGDLTSKGEMLMMIMRSGDSIQEKWVISNILASFLHVS